MPRRGRGRCARSFGRRTQGAGRCARSSARGPQGKGRCAQRSGCCARSGKPRARRFKTRTPGSGPCAPARRRAFRTCAISLGARSDVDRRGGVSLKPSEGFIPKLLMHLRERAFQIQQGRCSYCRQPMWLQDCPSFARRLTLTQRQAPPLRCTAEHLVARCDGGRNAASNIAAACTHCNQGRHRRKAPLTPHQFHELVQRC